MSFSSDTPVSTCDGLGFGFVSMLDSLNNTTGDTVSNTGASSYIGGNTNMPGVPATMGPNPNVNCEYQSHSMDNSSELDSPPNSSPLSASREQDGYQLGSVSPVESIPPRRKIRCKDEKICKVCGDKALGYNFNAMTCESCKAFFRRNARKPAPSSCLFQNECVIDLRTRRFCPSCRLAKCLSIGMKKEMILDDTERKARMQKVAVNRNKRNHSTNYDFPETPMTTVKEEALSDTDVLPDQSGCPSDTTGTSTLSEFIKPLDDKLLQAPYDIKLGLSYSDDEERMNNPDKFRVLTTMERGLFADLHTSYRQTIGSFVDKNLTDDDYNDVNDLVNHSEVAVRQLIKFIKRMDDFQILCQEDQITSLKACVLNSLLLRSAFFYSVKDDAWITPSGLIPTSILKKTTGYGEMHDIHTTFCRQLKEIIGNDRTLFALLQIIVVFMPDGVGLKERVNIANMQDKYYILLKHYLEASFSFQQAKIRFAKLMEKMCELGKLSDGHAHVLLQVNARDIEPLMLEVLNLK